MHSLGPRDREALLTVGSLAATATLLILLRLSGNPSVRVQPSAYLLSAAASFGLLNVAGRYLAPRATPFLLPSAALLHGLGYATVARLAPEKAQAQLLWTAASAVAYVGVLALLRDYRSIDRYRYVWAAGAVLALSLPLIPVLGQEINGSRLWVAVGPWSFQPGEVAKLLLVFFFSSYLLERAELLAISHRSLGPIGLPHPKHLAPVVAVWAVSFFVLILERDLGSSLLVFAIFLGMLYLATGRTLYQFVGAALFLGGAWAAYRLFPHVRTRVAVWLDPFGQFETAGYQIAQSLFSLGTGGVIGTGPGRGNPTLIPLAYTDFVFSAAGEELGMVGLVAVLGAYAILFATGFRVSVAARNPFGKLLAAGLTLALAVQTILVIGGVVRLLPLTGLATPFMSYGGSSLLANFVALAVLAAVSDQRDRPAPEQI